MACLRDLDGLLRTEVSVHTANAWSRLLGHGEAAAVNFFEDGIAASAQKSFAYFAAEFLWVIAVAGLPQDFRAVGLGHDCVEVQATVADFGGGTDRDLTASTEFIE